MIRKAKLSNDGKHRYVLIRIWDKTLPRITFIMYNPSIANAEIDDATIRRCIGFAKRWGYGGIYVGNVYSQIATCPDDLDYNNARGKKYWHWMTKIIGWSDKVVFAYGSLGKNYHPHDFKVSEITSKIPKNKQFCLGFTKNLDPLHPVRLSYDVKLIPFSNEL